MTEPITLDRAKQYLRVDAADDDVLIQGLITAAREYAEGFQNRVFVSPDPDVETETPGELEIAGMLMLIGHWYEHRESVNIGSNATEVPMSATACLSINRRLPV